MTESDLATKPAETLTAAHPARRLAVALNALDSYLTDHAPELRDSWEPLIEACFAALATKPAEKADRLRQSIDEFVNGPFVAGALPVESAGKSPCPLCGTRLAEAIRRVQGHPTESAGKRPEAVSAYRVWAKGGRFTRGLYEAKNMTETEFEIFAADGDTLEPLYTAETQRSSNATRSDDESAWIASLQPGERGAVQPPAPEPVAWLTSNHGEPAVYLTKERWGPLEHRYAQPLYTSPSIAQRGAETNDLRDAVLGILRRWGKDGGYDIDTCIRDLRAALSPERPE